jgi:hypothetical protein
MDGFGFYLADETGTVLIDAHAAEYDLPVSSTREVDSYQGTASSAPVAGSGGIRDGDLSRYVSYAQIRGVTERVGQFMDRRIEKTGASANPQVQAKQEALKELFAALPAMAQGGQPSTDVTAKLTAASGPLSDPEKEQRRQMFLAHLRGRSRILAPGWKPPGDEDAFGATGYGPLSPARISGGAGTGVLNQRNMRVELRGCRLPRALASSARANTSRLL